MTIVTRKRLKWLLVLFMAAFAGVALLYWGAVRDPIIRTATVSHPDWPAGARPITVLFMSDIHVAGPDMPPERLDRIVALANEQRPDLFLIGGDIVSDKRVATRTYPLTQAINPLTNLRGPTVAVLGNHDHWRDAAKARRQLAGAGIMTLDNEVRLLGALGVAGYGDDFTGHADVENVGRLLRGNRVPVIGLSHSPDIFPDTAEQVPIMFAGHTHCGQIRLPLIGALATMSEYGDRYACGRINEEGRTLFVSAGLGTSLLPFRLGARPDMWLVTIGP